MSRRTLLLIVVVLIAVPQAYGVAQSYSGRVEIVRAQYDSCLNEARARWTIVSDPGTPPAVSAGAAPLTAPTEPARRALCRSSNPLPGISPLP